MDSAVEAALRARIIQWVHERADLNGGFLHRDELLTFSIDGGKLPVIDFSRGIRNPKNFSSTLSIVSVANGPYDDAESDSSTMPIAPAIRGPETTESSAMRWIPGCP
ncbi:hypothetical protein ACFRCR_12315 [Oerskovia sp. NPDC056781]|uniref:hypothetical protein n=1 Tax=Oerskovia sp. NPDC056781 TaxID=3345942 RepID=UPI00366D3AD0